MRILFFSLFICVVCSSSFAQTKVEVLPVNDFKFKLTKDSTIQLVDVRTPEEFRRYR